ncbi:very-long-chain (3R)-3-hydroxyacyl-CoA dehydratase PASTICCINO 2A isoform X2 [Brachypodium distachyon]|nr:very-long-chain (3R)-3-hydroxyacyl-CoA dehydratase PASTICCINO 2A isoform X2 [Brachypodium distachyon]|eukprot:XP_024315351.1 very-long-chain (3R)-3-hydroxyacyl-CoA dehydratase PASTICCINO 2A isoform X2 [Brachypodium distachyon]
MPYDRSMLKIKNINCTIAASSSSLVDLYLQTAIYSSAMAALRRLYLSVYNWAVCFGWVQVLYNAASALLESRHDAVYPAVERPLLFAQTTAFLEILHSILGFVRSPISVTLPQISGRLYVTWGILWSFPETHSHILVTSLIISWSITEIIRYSFFGMREAFGFAPSWLLWLRYSTFLVFYPIGLISEVGLIYVAMPSMKASEKYCFRMPNKWNLSFDYRYMSVLLTALYVPGFPYLFRYMVAKREKALSKTKTA